MEVDRLGLLVSVCVERISRPTNQKKVITLSSHPSHPWNASLRTSILETKSDGLFQDNSQMRTEAEHALEELFYRA